MNEFMLGFISSLIGGIAILVIQMLIQFIREQKGSYTGLWNNCIYDEQGKEVKKDIVMIRQRGSNIFGDIKRVIPAEQSHRQWKFRGVVRDRNMLVIFWPVDQIVSSYGVSYMHPINDFEFEGFYLGLAETDRQYIKTLRARMTRVAKKAIFD
ncbi:hypothetical protein GC175_14075 [bacterium]|nr:hypothetical protein [bacterium]